MYKYLFFITSLFSLLNTNAQTYTLSNSQTTQIDILRGSPARVSDFTSFGAEENDLTNIKGSPYYMDFKIGEVFINDKSLGRHFLRYNGLSDNIEFKKNDEVFTVNKIDGMKVIIEDITFKLYNKSGEKTFFLKFNEGETSLLLSPRKSFKKKVLAKNSYSNDIPAKFVDEYNYYILKDNEIIEVELKKKDITKVLEEHKNKMLDYASDNKLNFKNEDEVVKLIDYYNSI